MLFRCSKDFTYTNIIVAEKELAVEVRLLDVVHIRYVHHSSLSTSEPHHSEVL